MDKLCVNCGTSTRYKNGSCKFCSGEYRKANAEKRCLAQKLYVLKNPLEKKEQDKRHRELNGKKIRAKQKEWVDKNRDHVNAKCREWRRLNPEKAFLISKRYRDNNPEAKAAYYKANTERSKAHSRAWYVSNTAYANANSNAWAKANPEATRIIWQNRRARKLENGGVLSKGLSAKLFALQKGKCTCCGKPLGKNYHLDHIVPLALGGANEDSNMQLLRKTCNLQKSAKHPVEFMQQRGFLL